MGVDGLAQQIKATFLNDRTAQNNSTLTQLQAEFASALEYLGQVMRYPTRKGDGAYLLRAVTNILDNAALGRNLWPQVETLLLQHIFQTRQWSEFPGVSTDLRADVVARKVAAVTAEVEKRVPTNATSYTFGDSGYRILVGSVPAVADIKHLMFKVLSPEGQAIHSGSSRGFQWPLPTRNTTTGRWEQAQPTTPIVGTVKACNSGYHLAPGTNLLTWLAPRGSNAVSIWLGKYTIAEGNDADIETDKIAVRQVTLTRGFENTLNPKTARAWVANFIQTYLFTAEELASDTFKPVVDFIKSYTAAKTVRGARTAINAYRNSSAVGAGRSSKMYSLFNALGSIGSNADNEVVNETVQFMKNYDDGTDMLAKVVHSLLFTLETWKEAVPEQPKLADGTPDPRPVFDENINGARCGDIECEMCYPQGYPFSTLPDGSPAPAPATAPATTPSTDTPVVAEEVAQAQPPFDGVAADAANTAVGLVHTEECPDCGADLAPGESCDCGGEDEYDDDDDDDSDDDDDIDDDEDYLDDEDDEDALPEWVDTATEKDLSPQQAETLSLFLARARMYPSNDAGVWATHNNSPDYQTFQQEEPVTPYNDDAISYYTNYGCPSALLAVRCGVDGSKALNAIDALLESDANGNDYGGDFERDFTEALQDDDRDDLTDFLAGHMPTIILGLMGGRTYWN